MEIWLPVTYTQKEDDYFSLALGVKNEILSELPFSLTLDKWLNFTGSVDLFSHFVEGVYYFPESLLHQTAAPILLVSTEIWICT